MKNNITYWWQKIADFGERAKNFILIVICVRLTRCLKSFYCNLHRLFILVKWYLPGFRFEGTTFYLISRTKNRSYLHLKPWQENAVLLAWCSCWIQSAEQEIEELLKFWKDSPFYFSVPEWGSWSSGTLKSMVIYFTENYDGTVMHLNGSEFNSVRQLQCNNRLVFNEAWLKTQRTHRIGVCQCEIVKSLTESNF